MKLVLEITSFSGDGHITHRLLERFPATIGRGYHNDVIIGDPAISAHHLRIDFDGNEFTVHEIGGENGMSVNDKAHKAAATHLKSGDLLRIGRTEIRVFDPQHPVPAAQRIAKTNPFVVWLSRPVHVWLSFVLAIGAYLGWTYLEVWDPDIDTLMVRAAIGAALGILLWSVLWGVAGRLVRHKSRFRSHVALASLTVISFVAMAIVEYYVDFLTNEGTFSEIFSGAVNLALFATLLYMSLTLATDLPQKKKRIWSGCFAGGLLIAFVALNMAGQGKFSQAPDYAGRLEPYLSSLAAAQTPDAFLGDSDKLFTESSLFNKKSDEKTDDKADDGKL